ncbi:hypothetical protein Tco_0820624 [Tanacetum coccineum]|uniref:Uncharacterized protein n=1 Tax=Tanacetum coccineum TaxID=301880 RepID=A0ABQ5A9Z1_9ASTR
MMMMPGNRWWGWHSGGGGDVDGGSMMFDGVSAVVDESGDVGGLLNWPRQVEGSDDGVVEMDMMDVYRLWVGRKRGATRENILGGGSR